MENSTSRFGSRYAATEEGAGGGRSVPAMYVQVEHRPPPPPPASQPAATVIKADHDGKTAMHDSLTPVPMGVARPPSRYVVTVKLECPDGQVITQAWTLTASAGSLKERLAKLVELPVATLHLIHAGRQVQDHVTLGELGGRANETVSLSLRSADPVVFPIKIKPGCCLQGDELMPLPDVITVRVHNPRQGRPRDLVVEIQNHNICQPFLGGWRRKKTGVCYYHAQTQTDYSFGVEDEPRLVLNGARSRDRQVATFGENHTQTMQSVSCQVRNFEWNLSRDAQITAPSGRYVTYEDAEKSAIVIQRSFKRYMLEKQKETDGSDPVAPSPTSWEGSVNEKDGAMEPVESLIIRFGDVTIEKKTRNDQPVNNEETNSGGHRLMYHEIEMLNSTRSSAAKDQLLRRLLHRVSQPKVWKASTGAQVQVDTAEIEHLRAIRVMYEAICSSTLTEERVKALHLLKRTLWKETGPLVKELLQLADRELDLLSRGLMSSALSGLQSRMRCLLRHYITEILPRHP